MYKTIALIYYYSYCLMKVRVNWGICSMCIML